MNYKCKGCGIEFKPNRKGQIYCCVRCSKLGNRNPAWKGDAVTNKCLHRWVEEQIGRPDSCTKCGKKGKVDLANKSELYLRDLDDWEWLCRKCHMDSDGRLAVFLSHSAAKKLPLKQCPNCLMMFEPPLAMSKYCSQSCATSSRNKERWRLYREQLKTQ